MTSIFQDIWNDDMFGVMAMTKAINKVQYVPSEFETLVNWEPDTSLTDDVALDISATRVEMLPFTPRDGQLPTLSRESRFTIKVPLSRYGQEDNILNSQVRGIRDTGTVNFRTVQGLRDKSLGRIIQNVNKTSNYLMARAFDGVVVDPKTGVLVCDIHQKMGTKPAHVSWDFSNAALDPNTLLKPIKRYCEDKVGEADFTSTRYVLACGRNFYIAFCALPKVVEAFKAWADKTSALRFVQVDRDVPFPFVFADEIIVKDLGRARIDGNTNGFIDDDSAYLLPLADGFYRTIVGTSDLEQFLGNPLPFYTASAPIGRPGMQKGITIMGDTVRMYFAARPEAIVRIDGVNIPSAQTSYQDVIQFG